jgi:hypothetical protein
VSVPSPSLPAPDVRARNGQLHRVPAFLLALLAGVGLHLAALALFHFNIPSPAPRDTPAPFVHFTKAADADQDKLMRQADAIWDPRLVYTPTARNYAARPVEAAAQPSPRVFQGDAGAALPSAKENINRIASSGVRPVSPSDALKPTQWDFLSAIGQTASASPQPPSHGPQLRVTPQQAGAEAAVMEVTWDASMTPKTSNARWQPASFLLVFSQTGLAGQPLLEHSSGVTEVDNDLSVKLRQWYSRHRLPAGYYSVEVGP